jgi:hypothetical protein
MRSVQRKVDVATSQPAQTPVASRPKQITFENAGFARPQQGFIRGEVVLNLTAATMLGAGVALFAPPLAAGLAGVAAFALFSKASERYPSSEERSPNPRASWFGGSLANRVDIEMRSGIATITPKSDENATKLWPKLVAKLHKVLPEDFDFPNAGGYAWTYPNGVPLTTLHDILDAPRSSATFAGLVVAEQTSSNGVRIHVVPESRLGGITIEGAGALQLGPNGPSVPSQNIRFMQGYANR